MDRKLFLFAALLFKAEQKPFPRRIIVLDFQIHDGPDPGEGRRPLVRTDAADMLKRRLKQAGLPAHYSPHSFRATGITNFLENDGTFEAAQ